METSTRHALAMPWKEQNAVNQREAFVRAFLKRQSSMVELCREFSISRKTGYKWTQRFLEGGLPNLLDRSSTPHHIRHAVDADVIDAIVEVRKRFPTWGPKKLCAYLEREKPELDCPALSTISAILSRHGLIKERRLRRRTPQSTFPLAAATAPNIVWCTDFKGKFRVNRVYCHPLTITDACSRYIFKCDPFDAERFDLARPAFESVFREYGLPLRMRSDNGSPFATRAIGALSKLSIWWIKLGILPERIQPGHPEQNGRHERMHRTLKYEAASPPMDDWEQQRAAFERWRHDFNNVRPHEALGMATPASRHEKSPRAFPEKVTDPEYPDHFEIRRVSCVGVLRWQSEPIGIGQVLADEAIGIEEVDNGVWHLWFGPVFLGRMIEVGQKKFDFKKEKPPPRRQLAITS